MFKSIFRAAAGLFLLVTALFAPAHAASRDEFSQRIQQAFGHADKAAGIAGLFHFQNMDAETRALYDKFTLPRLGKSELETVDFAPLPGDYRLQYVQKGYEYRPNLPPVGLVVMNGKMKIPYGEYEGRYYFIGMQRTLVNANPPEEKTLQVMVYGFANEPVRFKGVCQFLQSNGETMEMKIEDNGHGNNTVALTAVRVEACRVRNTSGEGQLTMRILEADDVIFEREAKAPQVELSFQRQ